MKKFVPILLATVMTMSLFAGCSSTTGENNTAVNTETVKTDIAETEAVEEGIDTEASATPEKDTTEVEQNVSDAEIENAAFVLEYPSDMQALGYTQPLALEEIPERVVCLSAAPVLALYEMGVNLVGVPSSMVVTWPEDLAANASTVSFSVMSPDDFDYEAVVALEPDLVMLAVNGADTAGAKLEELGIDVYYLYAGHTVSYDSVKMQTEVLINAFSLNEDAKAAGEDIMNRFEEVEANVAATKEAFAGKSVMVLQSGSADVHYIQTANGTLGSMLEMIGFENVYENETSSMVQLDFEQALSYNPDYVVCVGASDAATHQTLMDEAFANNPEYWNAIEAVANDNVICVDVTYISTAGINVIDNINNLISIMSEATGIAVE